MKTIFVTGGAGYIGSHTVIELLKANYAVVILDNFCNSSPEVIQRIKKISSALKNCPPFVCELGDVRDINLLGKIFSKHTIHGVIHFAGLKAVGESVTNPMEYYDNNLIGTITLCQAMRKADVSRLVFSSSATVYGENAVPPYNESMPIGKISNPYGSTKAMVEKLLSDLCKSDASWSVAQLRYFNPIGAHNSGLIGEDPRGVPNNLLPYISQVAVGALDTLRIYGNDYDTPDGTGVRDYIHVVDLAHGHIKAMEKIEYSNGEHIWNLGTGKGYSVLEIVNAFEQASGEHIPYTFEPRRAGDIAAFWADPKKTKTELGWQTKLSLKDMMRDTWRWQSTNPQGYES